MLELGSKIQSEVQSEMGKSQREYLLREQLKAIRKELGEGDEQAKEIEELRQKIEAAGHAGGLAEGGIARARPSLAHAGGRGRVHGVAHLHRLADRAAVGRADRGEDRPRPEPARRSMATTRVSRRPRTAFSSTLAVRKLNPEVKGPILCFVGPPGVARRRWPRVSPASMERKFVRVSLGGMRDEAEIRGHRRTYIGALPGQIMQGLRRAESKNPGLHPGRDRQAGDGLSGDPASALLEVLDPEQNSTFRDHYIDLPFDLSEVLFITTANVLDPIPPALRDRMEVLELPGYTEEEKLVIATEHLLARQIENHGLTAEQVVFTEQALRAVIRGYTREAGGTQPRTRGRRPLPQGGTPAGRGRRVSGGDHAGDGRRDAGRAEASG